MPTSEVIVSLGGSLIALLGGGGVVLVAICGFVSKIIADRTIESHKSELNAELECIKNELVKEGDIHRLKIKKAEILFERELEAVAEFGTLYRRIMPRYNHPDMDWDDARDDVAKRFQKIEDQIENYLTKHAPVLTGDLRERLRHCKTIASHNKFAEYEMPDEYAKASSMQPAGELLEELGRVETGMFEMVKNEARS